MTVRAPPIWDDSALTAEGFVKTTGGSAAVSIEGGRCSRKVTRFSSALMRSTI